MKYLEIDNDFFKTVDSFFNTNLEYSLRNEIEPDELFSQWTHSVNIVDLETMFEDLQKELHIQYYVPKHYRTHVIKFLNFIIKKIECLKIYYLSPDQKYGIFREYSFYIR